MSSLYLEPEDLIYLSAQNSQFREEQLHFHMTYYEGVGKIHKKAEAHLALAACALLGNKVQYCQELLKNFSQSDSAYLNYLFYFLSGLVNEKLEQQVSALEDYYKARCEESESIKNPFLLVKRMLDCFISIRRYSEAIEYFPEVSSFSVEFQTPLCSRLGYCCEMVSMTEKALFWYSKVTSDCPVGQACLVWAEHLAGKDVLDLLNKHRSQVSEDQVVLACDWDFLLSLYHISKDDLEKALDILKKITEFTKKDVYFSALGFVYYKKKKIVHAFVSYLKSLKLNPKASENWYNLAVIYNKVNQSESGKALEKARKIDSAMFLQREIDSASELILPKMNFSEFSACPKLNGKKQKKSRKVAKTNEMTDSANQIITPAVHPFQSTASSGFQMSQGYNQFYDSLMRFWNPEVFQRFPIMPSFNFFANRPSRPPESQQDLNLPKKRGRK